MNKNRLLKYLLTSPNLPVGGFCYSEGMESYLNIKNITNPKDVKEFLINELEMGQIRLDAKILEEFYDIFSERKNKDNQKENNKKLLGLDKWILSTKDSVEIREQQSQMSKSLFELTKEFGFIYPYEKNQKSSWSLAWSWACFNFEISKEETIENYLYVWTSNQLSAALRLIPIGSTKAQLIQLDLLELISKVSAEIMAKKINGIYVGNVGLAIAQQKHDDLYTKLFRN